MVIQMVKITKFLSNSLSLIEALKCNNLGYGWSLVRGEILEYITGVFGILYYIILYYIILMLVVCIMLHYISIVL